MSRRPATLSRLRALCLALPQAEERATWDHQTFRVRDKIFAMHVSRDGAAALWCKAPPGTQHLLIAADPERFFRPPYVGPKGWIGVRLTGRIDWTEVDALVRRSWRMTVPKRLAATLPEMG
ncbi:MAG: MmcQ/YjbR family DNA-binding protein [Acetobacteraceae bacterium]|nr:MmcQ/YjbR family DNA-binding protein [Acetobacteraceae bacterium]